MGTQSGIYLHQNGGHLSGHTLYNIPIKSRASLSFRTFAGTTFQEFMLIIGHSLLVAFLELYTGDVKLARAKQDDGSLT